MAPKELLTLRLLMDNPQGLFGSELVHLSKGGLVRGTVYTLLERLIVKDHVREVDEEPSAAFALKRSRYFVTKRGIKACQDFVQAHGLAVLEGYFGVDA
jgi:hypothetical protein